MRRQPTHLAAILAVLLALGVAVPANAQPAVAGAVTLTVWNNGYFPPLLPAFQQIDRAFMKLHPTIRIHEVPIPYSTYWAKLRTAIAARGGPDVVSLFPGVESADYKSGLLPLDSYITSQQRHDITLLNISAAPDGHTYALPYQAYIYAFYYNKRLFRKAGLDPNNPPQTWSSFLKACQALKAHGIVPISSGFKDGYELEWYIYPLSDQTLSKAQFVQWNKFNLPLTSPPIRESFTYFMQLVKGGYFTPHGEGIVLFNDAYNNFYAGKAAMFLGLGAPSEIQTANKDLGKGTLGIMMVPRVPDSHWPPFVDMGPNGGFGITNWSAHPKEAYAYLSYLESQHAQEVMWHVGGSVPNNRTAIVHSSDPVMNQVLSWIKIPADHTTYMGYPLPVLGVFEKYASELYTGQTTIDAVLQQAEQVRQSLASHVR